MAYNPTIWTNREVENPRTYIIIDNPDGTKTLVPAEGLISEPGTPIMAANMNKIEAELVKADNHTIDKNMHIIDGSLNVIDSRNVNNPPSYYHSTGQGRRIHHEFKMEQVMDLPSASGYGYATIVTYAKYTDPSGGDVVQLAIRDGGSILSRSGRNDVWQPWVGLVTPKLPPRILATLNAGWSGEISYYKDSFGVVHVHGNVYMGASPTHSITDLPVGFRPSVGYVTGAFVFEPGVAQTGSCRITVGVDGSLKYYVMPVWPVGMVTFDFSFRTD